MPIDCPYTALDEHQGTVTSIFYPDLYPDDANCTKLIRASKGIVMLSFDIFEVEEGESCEFDKISVSVCKCGR